jgi:teichoic acid transport system permease protein
MTTTNPSPVYYARRFNEYMAELWRRRDFVWFLARGNIKARNASTVLGLAWWVLNPLLLGFVYFFIFGLIFPTQRDIAYLLSGIFVFHFSAQSMSGGANSIIGNSKLLVNIRFPRLILPIAFLLESTFGFLASLVVLYLIVVPFADVVPGPEIVLLLVALPFQIAFNLGLAAATARLAVPFRDITNFIPYLTRVWLYMSPIIWPLAMLEGVSETAQSLFRLNPMFPIISVYRSALLGYPLVQADLVAMAVWCVAVGIVGVAIFIKYEGRMVRYL